MKEKLPLIVGILIPILLILFVVVSVYLPSLFVKPKYDFVYTTNARYDYDVKVLDGKISATPRYNDQYYSGNQYRRTPPEPTFFVYDVTADKSKSISLAQAQTYNLDSSNKSPDGFTVGRNESDGYSFFPFFYGSSQRGVYLQGKGLNRKIQDQYYDFQFLGWVLNE